MHKPREGSFKQDFNTLLAEQVALLRGCGCGRWYVRAFARDVVSARSVSTEADCPEQHVGFFLVGDGRRGRDGN